MPLAAIISGKIFCVHGGISPELVNPKQINRIKRPTDVPDSGLMCDILWGDPDDSIEFWDNNSVGISYLFGKGAVEVFLRKNELDLICRSHQVVSNGYEYFANGKLVTIFSATNYCGEFDNLGAMMSVDESLSISFQILDNRSKLK